MSSSTRSTDATTVVGLSRPDYFCAIVVKADSPVVKPTDLKGMKVAMDDVGSTSGHLCPSQLLADYGVEPADRSRLGRPHHAADRP